MATALRWVEVSRAASFMVTLSMPATPSTSVATTIELVGIAGGCGSPLSMPAITSTLAWRSISICSACGSPIMSSTLTATDRC